MIRWGGQVVTTTVDQVEQQFDKLVKASVERLKPVREAREEMQQLMKRIESLEAKIETMSRSDDKENEE